MFAEKGAKAGMEEIRQFLPVMSKNGSGDDVSMAGLICEEVRQEVINLVWCQKEYSVAQRRDQRLSREIAVANEKLDYIKNSAHEADACDRPRRFETEYEGLLDEQRKVQTALAETKSRLDAAEISLHGASGEVILSPGAEEGEKKKPKRIGKKKNGRKPY